MRKLIFRCLFIGLICSPALSEEEGLRSLETGVDANPWEAVGRLDIGGNGFCTGALVAPDLVLTAAHCLFDKASGVQTDFGEIEFLAGWRNGRASAYRNVRQAVVHPDYEYGGPVSAERVRNDVALLRLDRPIRNTTVVPFPTARRPARGARVGVVSYARDRSEAPSLQEVCDVLGHQDGVLVTTCSVDFGSSGAPIFTFDKGTARIVSVVSAMAEIEGQKVSLGTDLAAPLALLREAIDSGSGFFSTAQTTAAPRSLDDARRQTGAKFVRPEQ